MQPSSLIFVVVIGIWAAFLVQYCVRRREYLATARSIDRFSEAMRVLDRRSRAGHRPAASTGASRGSQASTADSLGTSAHGSRPSSLLSGSAGRSPLVARGPAPQELAPGAAAAGPGVAPSATVEAPASPEPGDLNPPTAHPPAQHSPAPHPPTGRRSGATLRAARRGASPGARRARALGLALALFVVPVTVVAAAAGMAPAWAVAVAFAEVGLCLVALRLAAVREQTARHTDRSMRASLHQGAGGSRSSGPRLEGAAISRRSAPEGASAGGHGGDRGAEDVDWPSPAAQPAPPAYRPGDPTWRPVPVPRPTYQLKDPAPPARRSRAAQERPFDGEQPQEPPARLSPSRRVVGG